MCKTVERLLCCAATLVVAVGPLLQATAAADRWKLCWPLALERVTRKDCADAERQRRLHCRPMGQEAKRVVAVAAAAAVFDDDCCSTDRYHFAIRFEYSSFVVLLLLGYGSCAV